MKSELQFSDYIYHLWTRRLFIVGFCFITLVLAYLGMRFIHGETFETKALMLVRSQPRLSAVESEELGVQPQAFQSLFTSDETIAFVRNQYNDMYKRGVFPPEATHELLEAPLEKLRPRFNVENGTTVDTTITTQFSPVLEFSVLGNTRDQALVLMELWTSYCLRTFGNLINDEAEVAIQSYEQKITELGNETKTWLQEVEQLRQEKVLVDTQIASNFRLLTKLPPQQAELFIGNDIMPFNMDTGPFQSNVHITPGEPNPEPGIWEEIYSLSIELNANLSDPEENGNSINGLEDRIKLLVEYAKTIETSIIDQQERSSLLASEIAAKEVHLNALQYAIRLNSSAYAQAQALRRPPADSLDDPEKDLAGNQEAFGTLRLMTKPVLPNDKFAPPRSLYAIIITIATGLFLLVVFSLERFMRHVIDLQKNE